MHKEFKIFSLISIVLLILSCDENTPIESDTTLKLFATNTKTLYFGDTLVVYGENFTKNVTKLLVVKSKDTVDLSDRTIFVNKSELRYSNTELTGSYDLIVKDEDQISEPISTEFYKYPNIPVVEIPSGSFIIGTDKGTSDERPPKEIVISKPFLMSVFEISQFTWKSISEPNTYFKNSRTKPVSNISWIEAIEFCNKLSLLWELTPAYEINGDEVIFDTEANGWRLPTEAEWEYAAKANTNDDFYGEENPNKIAWFIENSGMNIQPSGLLLPNNFGLYDMLGNLEEWCWDYYSANSYNNIESTDPIGVERADFRVSRGGSFSSGAANVRTNSRNGDNKLTDKGFRIVRNFD